MKHLSNYILWLLAFFMVMWAMCNEAKAHDIHLDEVPVEIAWNSFDGKQFKTIDGRCWEIYKSPHGDITSRTILHIREEKCDE